MTMKGVLGPARLALQHAVEALEQGDPVAQSNSDVFRLTQEAAHREGAPSRNETAARKLAAEAACMANTAGGGALLVGVSDDGTLVGAKMDAGWLRHRIYELTDRRLTCDVAEHYIRGYRVLAIVAPEAVEPIRWKHKIRWRVWDACVEVDAATWHDRRHATWGHDWSAGDSGVPAEHAKPVALAFVRDSLRAAADAKSGELADCDDTQLLRRLGAVTGHGTLTIAAHLLFVGRGDAALDYVYRDYPGGDSVSRVRGDGRSLAEELHDVFTHIDAHVRNVHIQLGLSVAQVQAVPRLAAREAVVNGVAHRDWTSPQPTVVEHVDSTFTVTSPGGFYGSVTENNVMTHPSHSRNKALTMLLADVKLAEREGIGVDRMTAEMIRLGHHRPVIRELEGPMVRTALLGTLINKAWFVWVAGLSPSTSSRDAVALLVLRHTVDRGWIDAPTAASVLQCSVDEAEGSLRRVADVMAGAQPVLQALPRVNGDTWEAFAVTSHGRQMLADLSLEHGAAAPTLDKRDVALDFASTRGRISSSQLAGIVGGQASNVGRVLRRLANDGALIPSSPTGRGQGFHYTPVTQSPTEH